MNVSQEQLVADFCGSELGRLIEEMVVVLEPTYRGIFMPVARVPDAGWGAWVRDCFHPIVVPCLRAAHAAGVGGRWRDVAEVVADLHSQLGAAAVARSRCAGEVLARRLSWPDRERVLKAVGCSGPSLPVAFACRTALFHIPFIQTMQGYQLFEASLAANHVDDSRKLHESLSATMISGLTPLLSHEPPGAI